MRGERVFENHFYPSYCSQGTAIPVILGKDVLIVLTVTNSGVLSEVENLQSY